MATVTDNGGPAFPTPDHYGMALRDWFAGQALAGLLAAEAPGSDEQMGAVHSDKLTRPANVWARHAYAIADAMLAARDEK